MIGRSILTRQELTTLTQRLGGEVNALRESLLQADAPFMAGVVRAAEEALLIAFETLNDLKIPVEEL